MKKLILLLLFIPLVSFGQDCPPCDIIANPGMETTIVKASWPKLKNKKIIKINSLTSVLYENGNTDLEEEKYWTELNPRS